MLNYLVIFLLHIVKIHDPASFLSCTISLLGVLLVLEHWCKISRVPIIIQYFMGNSQNVNSSKVRPNVSGNIQ